MARDSELTVDRASKMRDKTSERGVKFEGMLARIRDLNRVGMSEYEEIEPHSVAEVGLKFSF